MTSTFDELFSPAQDRIYDVFGVAATYNEAEVTVCIDDTLDQISGTPGTSQSTMTIRVRPSEVSSPRAGDAVTVRGETWHVSGKPRRDGQEWVLDLTQETRSVQVGA